jgi:hypothetical protein
MAEFQRFIHEFLNELLENEELSAEYDQDADAAMESYGLSADQRQLMREGTNQEIRKELKKEMKTHIAYVIRM